MTQTLTAIAAVRSPSEVNPFENLIESGLLWWINHEAFHPLGRKLEVVLDDDGHAIGFVLSGDGFQSITHDPSTSEKRSEAFQAVVVPDDGKPTLDWYQHDLD